MSERVSPLDRLRILVLGYMVRGPFGGLAWHHLQYALGLARLGHDVYFFEDSGDGEWWYYDPSTDTSSTDPSYGLQFADVAFREVGLDRRWTYYDARSRWVGPCAEQALDLAASADVLLNVSCVNPLHPWLMNTPVSVLIDTDPVFTQIDKLTKTSARSEALHHTAFLTLAENFGNARCSVFPTTACRGFLRDDQWSRTRGRTLPDCARANLQP